MRRKMREAPAARHPAPAIGAFGTLDGDRLSGERADRRPGVSQMLQLRPGWQAYDAHLSGLTRSGPRRPSSPRV